MIKYLILGMKIYLHEHRKSDDQLGRLDMTYSPSAKEIVAELDRFLSLKKDRPNERPF